MFKFFLVSLSCVFLIACQTAVDKPTEVAVSSPWETASVKGQPTARHEAAFVEHKGKGYLIGGRRINPVDVFDPSTNSWTEKSKTPIELHHFQAVSHGEAIYILGAFTDGWPNEKPVDRVIKYYPETDKFEYSHWIPQGRARGAAGAVVYKDKIYLVGGITHGHMSGTNAWFDEYDPRTGNWRTLPDAPVARDHFQAVIVEEKLYSVAGRRSSQATNQGFELTVKEMDVFDFKTGEWQTLPESANLPTQRAGNMAINWDNTVIVAGGESGSQMPAHNEVEQYDPATGIWSVLTPLNEGRHGTGFAILDNTLVTASGCGMRGGEPELATLERFFFDSSTQQRISEVQQWHTLTLSFYGPQTSESAIPNPFTDYRLLVEFTHADSNYTIRGFYAADGNSAHTSADAGDVWQVRFSPDKIGEWQYKAWLHRGTDIALSMDKSKGIEIPIEGASGSFQVRKSDKDGADFRAHGRLVKDKGFYKFAGTEQYWLKGGTNSPENLLAFDDFDGTYRVEAQNREGEAAAKDQVLHRYAEHAKDWRRGDPSWKNGKGKNLIGALNYLASMGMNTAYFLTLNINGDGKDVWPYLSHSEFERFDVSKLAQWDLVFSHMQQRGIMLHMVTQETENELLLDEGETGRLRQLYYLELIARFAHHPALSWNLGEENGPAHWLPQGQNHQQRRDMSSFINTHDPYNHPILLHTHSTAQDKEELLPPLLGFKPLDGMSFQVDDRTRVHQEIRYWRAKAKDAGHDWLITMDEIGMWHTGALNDFEDPDHDSLRQHVLWGTLLAGGAGVEWYFGAQHPNNDLTSEDWRNRHNLWTQTKHALDFFNDFVPFWELQPVSSLLSDGQGYAASIPGELYLVYVPAGQQLQFDFELVGGEFSVDWFDPKAGGSLRQAKVTKTSGFGKQKLITPDSPKQQDWVGLIRKLE